MKKAFKIGCVSVLGLFALFLILSILLPEPSEKEVKPAKQESLHREQPIVEEKKPIPPKTPFEVLAGKASLGVSAPDLHEAYESNEFAADEKYKGKIILVRGIISNMQKTLGTHYLYLESGNFLASVSCGMQKNELPILKTLAKGQDVVVVGEVTGVFLGGVRLKKCLVITTSAYDAMQKK